MVYATVVGFDLVFRPQAPQVVFLFFILKVTRRVAETMCIGIFSGGLCQHGQSLCCLAPQPLTRSSNQRYARVSTIVGDIQETEELQEMEEAWDQKVAQLAGRGIPLCNLLDFMKMLLHGSIMPSFVVERSTTNDVVRQAIIPMSRDADPAGGGHALASIWSQGQAVAPERMVTHSPQTQTLQTQILRARPSDPDPQTRLQTRSRITGLTNSCI